MSARNFFAMLFALAVLIAPASISPTMAASPQHDMQMLGTGHCNNPPPGADHHDRMDGKTCCISMCMGVAIAPAAPLLEHEIQPAPAIFAIAALHLAYLGEIATPPPRNA